MLHLIKNKGVILSKNGIQIADINSLIKKINKYEVVDPQKSEQYYYKLSFYHHKIMKNGDACMPVRSWFEANPLYRIHQEIKDNIQLHQQHEPAKHGPKTYKRLTIKMKELYSKHRKVDAQFNTPILSPQLPQNPNPVEFRQQIDDPALISKENVQSLADKMQAFFGRCKNKEELIQLVIEALDEMDSQYKIVKLSAHNDPIIYVSNEQGERFIIRLLTMDRIENTFQSTQIYARNLLEGIKQVPAPYILRHINNNENGANFLECSAYYEQGNLDELFANLPTGAEDNRGHTVLLYTRKIVELFAAINEKNVWYTDLKPSNILLDSDSEIVLSDIKGLLFSTEEYQKTINTTNGYFSSSVYNDNGQINLELIQRQTLANSIYQLLCNQLADSDDDTYTWEQKYHFDKPCFQDECGQFLQGLIQRLIDEEHLPMQQLLEVIDSFIEKVEQSVEISSDTSPGMAS